MKKVLYSMALLASLGMTATLVGCATSGHKSETAGEYVDDSIVTSRVKAALFNEPTLKSMQISVKTYQGTVQLSGFVDSGDSVRRAGDVASRVEGVKSVRNDLIVK